MFQLGSPMALWALAGIALPVAIHLLSQGPRKRILVGSVRLLRQSGSRRLRRFKPHDLRMLWLRLALLTALAIVLARPLWLQAPQPNTKPGAEGWILVDPAWLAAQDKIETEQPDAQAALRDLAKNGSSLHLLADGLPPVDLNDRPVVSGGPENFWSLLREADLVVPKGAPLSVFTVDRLSSIRGKRPSLGSSVTWTAVSLGNENRWIHRARLLPDGQVELTLGSSNAQRTSFRRFVTTLPAEGGGLVADGMPGVNARPDGDAGWRFRLTDRDSNQDDDELRLAAASADPTFTILHDAGRSDDARFVRAALMATLRDPGQASKISIRTTTEWAEAIAETDVKAGPPVRAAVVFWLAAGPIPDALRSRVADGLNLFRDAESDRYDGDATWIDLSSESVGRPRLNRLSPAPANGTPLWRDGFGRVVLDRQSDGKGAIYTFRSRFHPAWTELVLHPAFPESLAQILPVGDPGTASRPLEAMKRDLRAVGASQMQPGHRTRALPVAAVDASTRSIGLALPLVLLVLAVFAVERWISCRRTL